MFGSRKKQEETSYLEKELLSKQIMLDRYFQVFSEIAVRQKEADKKFDIMESNQDEIGKQLKQITEYVNSANEVNARQTERSYALYKQAEKISGGIENSEQIYQGVIKGIKSQSEEMMDMVERGKEFVHPSRFLNQITTEVTLELDGMQKNLGDMENLGKQMGVVSLNAAIEAGRLGESGRDFLAAAENVRGLADEYQKNAVTLTDTIEKLQNRLTDTEEQVNRLNQLIRETNTCIGNVTRGYTNAIYQLENSDHQNFASKTGKLAEYMKKMTENNKVLAKQHENANKSITDAEEKFSRQLATMEELRENSEVIKEQIKVAKLASMEQ
ncbi:MAG: methyl-accepting chemotaxis protein [Lachnospiraceae bacterium]